MSLESLLAERSELIKKLKEISCTPQEVKDIIAGKTDTSLDGIPTEELQIVADLVSAFSGEFEAETLSPETKPTQPTTQIDKPLPQTPTEQTQTQTQTQSQPENQTTLAEVQRVVSPNTNTSGSPKSVLHIQPPNKPLPATVVDSPLSTESSSVPMKDETPILDTDSHQRTKTNSSDFDSEKEDREDREDDKEVYSHKLKTAAEDLKVQEEDDKLFAETLTLRNRNAFPKAPQKSLPILPPGASSATASPSAAAGSALASSTALVPQKQLEEEDTQDLIFKTITNQDDESGTMTTKSTQQVKAGTATTLVQRLTSDKQTDPKYTLDFLFTYRSFMTPIDLITRLIDGYTKADASEITKLRTCNVFRTWLSTFPDDFAVRTTMNEGEDKESFEKEQIAKKEFCDKFNWFINEPLKKEKERLAESLIRQLQTISNTIYKPPQFETNPPTVRLSKSEFFYDWDVVETARQITIIESAMFNSIKPIECIGLAWQKNEKEINSPNICKMIEHFNDLSHWVVKNVLAQSDLKMRVKMINKFIKLADHLRKLNNFNGLMEILSGLQNAAVFRLKKTWEKCENTLYESLAVLLASKANHSKYREVLHKNISPPLVPYLGIYLTDLTFIEEGNKDFLTSPLNADLQLINFEKRRKYAEVLREIKTYQCPYNLTVEPNLTKSLLTQLHTPHFTEGDLYNVSLELEPRDVNVPPVITNPSQTLALLRNDYVPPPPVLTSSGRSFGSTLRSFTFGSKKKPERDDTGIFKLMEVAATVTADDRNTNILPEVEPDMKIKQLIEEVEGIDKALIGNPTHVWIADFNVAGVNQSQQSNNTERGSYKLRILTDNIVVVVLKNGKPSCEIVFNAEFTRFINVSDSETLKHAVEFVSGEKHYFFCCKDEDEKTRLTRDVKKVMNDYKRRKFFKK